MHTNITAVIYTSYTFWGETDFLEQMNFELISVLGELFK